MDNGYMGKIIRVNFTNETIKTEPLNRQDAKLYGGARGLGTKYYMNEVDPKVDPLSAENNLIFMTGPLTGTLAACAGRYEVVSKAPLTGTIGACSLGGHFGPELKYAGYDGIIFEGKAKKPVYLFIDDDHIELRDASHLWGKDVPATTDEVMKETNEDVRVACIGPAGEKLVLFAVIMSDKNRAAGCSGLGAVMGSKNLKAIAVRGTKSIKVARQKEFFDACIKARTTMQANPVTGVGLSAYGTHNFGEGPEYEAGLSFGSDCGIDNLEAVCGANFLCNELGMDPVSMGSTIACAMELYQKGYVKADDAGMDVSFGNADAVVKLTKMTGYREGFGDKMAVGSYRMAEGYGHPELSMTVKKQEIPAFNVRAKGIGLEYATSNHGGSMFGIPKKMDSAVTKEKAAALKISQDLAAVVDSVGISLFTTLAIGIPEIAEMFRTCTGFEYTDEEVLKIGERIWNLEKIFNLKNGFSKKDDILPPILLNQLIPDSPAKSQTSDFEKMLSEYYAVRGWNPDGVPTKEKKKELSIE